MAIDLNCPRVKVTTGALDSATTSEARKPARRAILVKSSGDSDT
jgi:hypothetical protein